MHCTPCVRTEPLGSTPRLRDALRLNRVVVSSGLTRPEQKIVCLGEGYFMHEQNALATTKVVEPRGR